MNFRKLRPPTSFPSASSKKPKKSKNSPSPSSPKPNPPDLTSSGLFDTRRLLSFTVELPRPRRASHRLPVHAQELQDAAKPFRAANPRSHRNDGSAQAVRRTRWSLQRGR